MRHLFEHAHHVFYYTTCNMSEVLNAQGKAEYSEELGAIYLVINGENGVFVDERAPVWYRHLATMHEYICMNRENCDILPDIPDGDDRCAKIDLALVEKLRDDPELGSDYLFARREMFELLIRAKLNTTQPIHTSLARISEALYTL